MVPIRRDFADYILIGVLNLELDNWEDLTVTLEVKQTNNAKLVIDILDETGTLVPLDYTIIEQTPENLTFKVKKQTQALDFVFMRIRNNNKKSYIHFR